MKLVKLASILLGIGLLPAATRAADGNLETVLNAFIATYAKTNLAWKKDIVLTTTPEDVSPGRQLGLSQIGGYYTFTPKEWIDLSPAEQQELLADPRLTAFIISLRQATESPPGPSGTVPIGANGRPMFPAEGVTLDAIQSDSSAVAVKKHIVKLELSAEQVISGKSIRIESLK